MSASEPLHDEAIVRGRSLTSRLTLWFAITAFALVAIAILILDRSLTSVLSVEEDEILGDKVAALRRLLVDGEDNHGTLQHEVEDGFMWSEKCHVRILQLDGRPVMESPTATKVLEGVRFPAPIGADHPVESGKNARTKSDEPLRVLAALSNSRDGTRLIQVAVDRGVHEGLLARYRATFWPLLAAAVVVCALVGHRIARTGMMRVADIAKAFRGIRSTTLHERLDETGLPSELVPVSRALNGMLDRLADSFGRLSQFSADLAHELRTPVSNLRGEIEVTLRRTRSIEEYREVLASCLEECDRLSGLIDSMLFLARAENPTTQIERQDVNVGRELSTVQELYEPVAAEKGVTLEIAEVPAMSACLDRQLLQRAVGNLIANAIAHTPSGGTITVAATAVDDDLKILVRDNGSGIAAADLPFVFDRFFRADRARIGEAQRVGLGLAIVKGIATLHGGEVHIASEPGAGTIATINFPRMTKVS